jgi:hypothetical protein
MGAFTLNTAGLLALVIQFVLPLLVGLVTKRSMSPGIKAVLLLALTAVTQFVTAWLDAVTNTAHFGWQPIVFNIVVGFVISVAAHFGLWAPTGTTDKVQDAGIKDTPTRAVTPRSNL